MGIYREIERPPGETRKESRGDGSFGIKRFARGALQLERGTRIEYSLAVIPIEIRACFFQLRTFRSRDKSTVLKESRIYCSFFYSSARYSRRYRRILRASRSL